MTTIIPKFDFDADPASDFDTDTPYFPRVNYSNLPCCLLSEQG
jgi:hypothetical protein